MKPPRRPAGKSAVPPNPTTSTPTTTPQAATSPPPSDVVELSRFRADLSRGRRVRRADALLAADDPEAAIRSLPGDEFYYVLHELGFPDALDVLRHGTVPQVQAALDFALWDRDQVVPAAADEWLTAISDLDYEIVGPWAQGLDIELVAMLLRKRARIYDLSVEEAPDEAEGQLYTTPDRVFAIDVLGDDEQRRVTWHLIDSFYRYDQDWTRKVLVGTRSEMDSELEEHAFRWRSGRMADLGFEDYYDALGVYREIDPASIRLGDQAVPRVRPLVDAGDPSYLRVPSALTERLSGGSPFARALHQLSGKEELANVEAALVTLANRVLAADRIKPGDDEAGAAALARMAGALDMAVEFLGRAGPEDTVRAVRTVPVKRLHQLGISLIGKVRKLATTLLKRTPYAALRPALELYEIEDAEVLESCARPRAMFPRRLDNPPSAGERPFAALADLAVATGALERAAAAVTLVFGLGVQPAELAPERLAALGVADPRSLDTGVLGRTALARAWLSLPPGGLVALDDEAREKFDKYLKKSFQEPAFKAESAALLHDVLNGAWPGQTPSAAARAVIDRWIEGLLAGEPVLQLGAS